MLSDKVLVRQDIRRAASYYEDGADDYYAKDGAAKAGQGRRRGSAGPGRRDRLARFKTLLAGQVAPEVRRRRGSTRHDARDRIGIDLTFSAPKSVSLQALVGGDARVIAAHDRAVSAPSRRPRTARSPGARWPARRRVERSGNLIVAKFRHETSRERDPQLHTHALVLNLTQRRDGAWRALKNDEILKSAAHPGRGLSRRAGRRAAGAGLRAAARARRQLRARAHRPRPDRRLQPAGEPDRGAPRRAGLKPRARRARRRSSRRPSRPAPARASSTGASCSPNGRPGRAGSASTSTAATGRGLTTAKPSRGRTGRTMPCPPRKRPGGRCAMRSTT